jgi:4-alpha-glucanotransferase
MPRASGILLHPTSLPARFGIGDLGPAAYRFVDFLAEAGQALWQVLPLGPPGYGNSPYQSLSSLAGNPLLVSPEGLAEGGWLDRADLEAARLPPGTVDFGAVIPLKERLLRRAAESFFARAGADARAELETFARAAAGWLGPFAQFAALKERNGGRAWTEWTDRAEPDPAETRVHVFAQFAFSRQWSALRRYAAGLGISLIGDIPIFVAHDSSDVWSSPDLFDLDAAGRPRAVAGVPPDYFSATGQLWGNPLYRWDVMAARGYDWWIDRLRGTFARVDRVRLDHFRGFEKYWEIPAGSPTAVHGRWVPGPGLDLFRALERALGPLPVIAEDLGYITPEVHALREQLGFPGMRVLQFAFGSPSADDPFKPHTYVRNAVVYTGTHDNDTTLGWFRNLDPGAATLTAAESAAERERALRYLGTEGREIQWDFIRAALASVADTAIVPLQDVLGLGSEGRMNLPARAEGNWTWRFGEEDLRPALAGRLRELAEMYGRNKEPGARSRNKEPGACSQDPD